MFFLNFDINIVRGFYLVFIRYFMIVVVSRNGVVVVDLGFKIVG